MSNEHPNYGGVDEGGPGGDEEATAAQAAEEDAHDMETQRIGSSGRRGKRTRRGSPALQPQNQLWSHGHAMDYSQLPKIGSNNPSTTIYCEEEGHHHHHHSPRDAVPTVPAAIELGNEHRISSPEVTSPKGTVGRRRSSSWAHPSEDLHSLAETVFSDIRSTSTDTRRCISNEAEEYVRCSGWERAFPERSFALIVTLIFELPTLYLIAGGSDRLCALIGRKKYTTLVALLPLISAIAGNVGLQASTLTTRAISHAQVRVDNYVVWMGKEVVAALYLGIAIGVVLAGIAFCMGGRSYSFAFSIFIAQFIGILTAGCTGTLAPLLFTFIFQRDSGKWGGPLETAVQDVVGSFAMIVVTYRIMSMFGPFDLEPGDTC